MADKRHIQLSAEEEQLLLRKYFDGSATPEEAHLLERLALDDPMLAEAMEGFEAHGYQEGAIEASRKRLHDDYGDRPSFKRLWILGSLVLLAGVVWFVLPENSPPHQDIEEISTEPATDEQETDEGSVAPEGKQVIEQSSTDSSMSFTISKPKVEDPEPKLAEHYYTREEAPEQLPMLQPQAVDSTMTSEERTIKLPGAAIYHILDYKVVDYRRIRTGSWDSEELLGGTSAAQQSADDDPLLPQQPQQISYVDYLNETMAFFAVEDYRKANRRFIEILRHFDNDANALFYGGLSALELGEYSTAVERFRRSLDLPINTFHEESRFYLAVALKEDGSEAEASELFQTIAAEGGFYAERAKAALKQ